MDGRSVGRRARARKKKRMRSSLSLSLSLSLSRQLSNSLPVGKHPLYGGRPALPAGRQVGRGGLEARADDTSVQGEHDEGRPVRAGAGTQGVRRGGGQGRAGGGDGLGGDGRRWCGWHVCVCVGGGGGREGSAKRGEWGGRGESSSAAGFLFLPGKDPSCLLPPFKPGPQPGGFTPPAFSASRSKVGAASRERTPGVCGRESRESGS